MMGETVIRVGLDVGSTTVKTVVVDERDAVVWRCYERHRSHQRETVQRQLGAVEAAFPGARIALFTTGSGGKSLAGILGGVYVQEVNAVTAAVEAWHPDARTVVELGGQDAKFVVWKSDRFGRKNTVSFMNDKCAGGTGATLDKLFAKLNLSPEQIAAVRADGVHLHHVAAKCGVFAETDVTGLMKSGVPVEEIAVSLCAAVVRQNIEVLFHGHVPRDKVLLLGGPHTFIPALVALWRKEIPELWRQHNHHSAHAPIEDLVFVPEDAAFFAAAGAVLFGVRSTALVARELPAYRGAAALDAADAAALRGPSRPGLVNSDAEAAAFVARYRPDSRLADPVTANGVLRAALGIDGGSTSSKMVLVDAAGRPVYKDYVLSQGNPLSDVQAMCARLEQWLADRRIALQVTAVGVTGYATDILRKALDADTAIVETVAHLRSAQVHMPDVEVICDVGGQDIKVLFVRHGRVTDIKLNTQCSAGNGYFLQAMAQQFGIPIEGYADAAFRVRRAPVFNYGCAVFMEQDKVNFQQAGWSKEEIMAGLALVLPHNIWSYVVQETNLAKLGRRFLLQGGTQKNMAAVKAQVDFLTERIPDVQVAVHPHADVAGAIGAALVAVEQTAGPSRFIGLERVRSLRFSSRNDAGTRCTLCANRCSRTFVHIENGGADPVQHISGYACDKGAYPDKEAYRRRPRDTRDALDLVALAERRLFAPSDLPENLRSAVRRDVVVGIPRVLNLYYYAPFFDAYFRALGVADVVFSDATSKRLWEEGNRWGAIDPCFPAKVAPAHVHQLVARKQVDAVFFPIVTHLESHLCATLGENACVIQMGTPEVVEAAFTKGRDHFAEAKVAYLKPVLRMDRPAQASAALLECVGKALGVSQEEHERAWLAGRAAQNRYRTDMQIAGARAIDALVREDRMGILFIGHPYHMDTGLNHGIPRAFARRGYAVLPIEAIPVTEDFLVPLFGSMEAALRIDDVWHRNFNRNTNLKIWAAKVASRHPNLAVVDVSSFKCGHDAPTYSYVDRILDATMTPHFLFHDLDQNRPNSTFQIRIESIDFFLKEEQARLRRARADRNAS